MEASLFFKVLKILRDGFLSSSKIKRCCTLTIFSVLSLLFKLLIQIRTLKCPLSLILVYVRLVTEEASDRQSFILVYTPKRCHRTLYLVSNVVQMSLVRYL